MTRCHLANNGMLMSPDERVEGTLKPFSHRMPWIEEQTSALLDCVCSSWAHAAREVEVGRPPVVTAAARDLAGPDAGSSRPREAMGRLAVAMGMGVPMIY